MAPSSKIVFSSSGLELQSRVERDKSVELTSSGAQAPVQRERASASEFQHGEGRRKLAFPSQKLTHIRFVLPRFCRKNSIRQTSSSVFSVQTVVSCVTRRSALNREMTQNIFVMSRVFCVASICSGFVMCDECRCDSLRSDRDNLVSCRAGLETRALNAGWNNNMNAFYTNCLEATRRAARFDVLMSFM